MFLNRRQYVLFWKRTLGEENGAESYYSAHSTSYHIPSTYIQYTQFTTPHPNYIHTVHTVHHATSQLRTYGAHSSPYHIPTTYSAHSSPYHLPNRGTHIQFPHADKFHHLVHTQIAQGVQLVVQTVQCTQVLRSKVNSAVDNKWSFRLTNFSENPLGRMNRQLLYSMVL